jgi:hypothetical protein
MGVADSGMLTKRLKRAMGLRLGLIIRLT